MPMKSIVYLSFVLILMKCGGPKSPNFKILTGAKNNKAVSGDTLQLKLNKTFEAATVKYFLNNQQIAEDHVLTN